VLLTGDRKGGSQVWREEATKRVEKFDRAMERGGMGLNFEKEWGVGTFVPPHDATQRGCLGPPPTGQLALPIRESYPKWQGCCFHAQRARCFTADHRRNLGRNAATPVKFSKRCMAGRVIKRKNALGIP
jgi:hypothetical protein